MIARRNIYVDLEATFLGDQARVQVFSSKEAGAIVVRVWKVDRHKLILLPAAYFSGMAQPGEWST